uniref:Uncharacterized protein n=1 Tax=Tanacetum cinerariifolium TaxID=118510 RepID=A0A6L2KYV2_TANCI|nr:hypothetical protein [Tanacetum cinerariifolium]
MEHVANEVIHKELGDSLVRNATTASSLEAEHDNAQALKAFKTLKPKVKGIVIQEQEEPGTKTYKERAQKEQEANIELIETLDDIQAKIDVDHQLAERLQAQEQKELSDAEKATLFVQLLDKRKKYFAAKRAEEKRNKPPTQSQKRKIMYTYLKNIKGYKLKQLKMKEFDEIQEMFDKAFRRQNVDDDKEKAELKQLMKTIPDEEELAINVIPLAVKSSRIVDRKIHKEGKKSYYQIVRADGKSQMYMFFSQMLKSFDREDLEDLYKLVKARYESTRPVDNMDYLLWSDIKLMFEPHVQDEVWKRQQGYKVLELKLYDSCRVHSLRVQSM